MAAAGAQGLGGRERGLTSALLQEQLHLLLVLLLLQRQLAVGLQALPLQRRLQPEHQPLLLLQLHLQLREGHLLLVLLLAQRHHLRPGPDSGPGENHGPRTPSHSVPSSDSHARSVTGTSPLQLQGFGGPGFPSPHGHGHGSLSCVWQEAEHIPGCWSYCCDKAPAENQ